MEKKEDSQQKLLASLSVPMLDDMTTNSRSTSCDAALEGGTRGSEDTSGAETSINGDATIESGMVGSNGMVFVSQQEDKSSETRPSANETYFDKSEMRWKKRTVLPGEKKGIVYQPSVPDIACRPTHSAAKTLASKLMSPPSTPPQSPRIHRATCDEDPRTPEIPFMKKTGAAKKTLTSLLDSPPASPVSNDVDDTAKLTSTSGKKPTVPSLCPSKSRRADQSNNNQHTSPKTKTRSQRSRGNGSSPKAALLSPLKSPLKSISEVRQLSPYLPPKESLKDKLGLSAGLPFSVDDDSDDDCTNQKNNAFAGVIRKAKVGGKKVRSTTKDMSLSLPAKNSAHSLPHDSASKTGLPNYSRPIRLRCIMCDTNRRSVLMIPCKHLCVCADCSKTRGKDLSCCPLCRRVARDRVVVF